MIIVSFLMVIHRCLLRGSSVKSIEELNLSRI